jgi:hypothetical protein
LVFGYNSDQGIIGFHTELQNVRDIQSSGKTGRLITVYAMTYQGKFGNKRRANV